jgi:hypothetical protein
MFNVVASERAVTLNYEEEWKREKGVAIGRKIFRACVRHSLAIHS